MHSYAWFIMLLRVCLWFAVLVHSSVAVSNAYKNGLRNWIRQCNCSCLKEIPSAREQVWPHCTTKEAFTFDKQGYLQNSSNLPLLSTIPRKPHFLCQENLKGKNKLNKYILLNLSCNGERLYVIYRQRPTELSAALRNTSTLGTDSLPTTLPSKQEETKQGKSESPNRLVIGLTGIGLGLMVAIIVCWTWIRCRRRRMKKKADEKLDEKEQNPEFGDIDEEEDSAPYRIVDLQTNISCDASGYTFLEAPKQDEEQPYMKLQPKCRRVQNKECTEDANHSFEEVDNEDEERQYQTLRPTCSTVDNKDCTETDDFEEIADEPVYFMLEGKDNSKTS